MSKKVRDVVIKSREKAVVDFAYNINKIGFLPKLVDKYKYHINNKIRVISHILSNGFNSGYYILESDIKDNNLRLKEDQYGMIYEYLKDVDIETEQKEYKYMIKYNVEQLVEEDREKAIRLLNIDEINNSKKHNLSKKQINKWFVEKNYEDLEKNMFLAILNLEKGKNLDFLYRYDEDMKKTLIEYAESYNEDIRKLFFKINVDVFNYLKENEKEDENEKSDN